MAARRPVVWMGWRCLQVRPCRSLTLEDALAAVELAGRLEQDCDLLGAIEVHRPRSRELQAAALADRRVARDVAVVDGDSQDLRQQVDVHVDRARRQRSRTAAVASAQPIDIGHRQRRPVPGGRRDLGGFAHLALPVAVNLGHGDLGDAVVLEERQQVVGEVVPVAAGGVRVDLEALGREPIGRKLVEGRVGGLRRRGIRPRRPPGAKVDVAKHDGKLALRHRQSPAVLGFAEGQVLALA